MKKIDNLDSLQQFNFPNAAAKAKREKFGSFLLAIIGILGLFSVGSPAFLYSNTDAVNKEKTTKFWLTPSSLNAEQTALNTQSIQSSKTGSTLIVATDVAAKRLN